MTQGPGRSCLLCGGRPVRGEHVFPRWMSEWFKGQSGARSFTYTATLGPQRRASIIQVVSKWFCGPCNHKWMNDMEEAAKPLLVGLMAGTPVILDTSQQKAVATWGFKTVLTYLSTWGAGIRPPDDVYKRFRETGAPLAPVWIGFMAPSPTTAVQFGFQGMTVGQDPTPRPSEAWQVRFALQRLFIGVLHHERPGLTVRMAFPTSKYRSIWPSSARVDWPPPNEIPHSALND